MIKRGIYRIDSMNETQFYYPFMPLYSSSSLQSISAARNKMEEMEGVAWQKPCI